MAVQQQCPYDKPIIAMLQYVYIQHSIKKTRTCTQMFDCQWKTTVSNCLQKTNGSFFVKLTFFKSLCQEFDYWQKKNIAANKNKQGMQRGTYCSHQNMAHGWFTLFEVQSVCLQVNREYPTCNLWAVSFGPQHEIKANLMGVHGHSFTKMCTFQKITSKYLIQVST